MAGVGCRGDYCDDIRLECAELLNVEPDLTNCRIVRDFSDESGRNRISLNSSEAIVSIGCSGTHCDNKAVRICRLDPETDLVVSNLDTERVNVSPGSRLRVQAEIDNTGGVTAPGTRSHPRGYKLTLVLSTDENTPAGPPIVGDRYREDILLQGGLVDETLDIFGATTRRYTRTVEIPSDTPSGDYFICARVDPFETVPESDDDNNSSCAPIRVGSFADAGDMWISGIEATQSIQTFDPRNPDIHNRVPLIADKITALRVYVGRNEDSSDDWDDIFAALQIDSGPIRFLGPLTVPPRGSDRSRLDDSFLFYLPSGAVREGTRNVAVRIFTRSGRGETDLSNNRKRVFLNFNPRLHTTIDYASYANTGFNSDCASFPEGVRQRLSLQKKRFVVNTYPLSDISFRRFDDGIDLVFDNSDCTGLVQALAWAERQLALRFPGGGHRAALMSPDPGGGRCCNLVSGNLLFSAADDATYAPGFVIAHEYAHSFLGGDHSDDPATAYPHMRGGIGPQVGLRNIPLTTKPGLNSSGEPQNFDILSNNPVAWVSPYTYCRLMEAVSGRAMQCASLVKMAGRLPSASLVRTRVLGQSKMLAEKLKRPSAPMPQKRSQLHRVVRINGDGKRYIFVSGRINPNTNRAKFDHFLQVNSRSDIASVNTGKSYAITLKGPKGRVIEQYSFDLPEFVYLGTEEERVSEVQFGGYLRWHKNIKRIELLANERPINIIDVSPHRPIVKLTPIDSTVPWAGKRKLAWNGTDTDGDTLSYSIWYSLDKAESWTPIDVLRKANSIEVNFDELPGSDQVLFRVLATDGVNTAESIAKRTVTIPNKPPRVEILAPDGAKYQSSGQDLLLIAEGYDFEDGPLKEHESYSWQDSDGKILGSGRWITLSHLAPGKHKVAITVIDSAQQRTTTMSEIEILASRDVKKACPQVRGLKDIEKCR